MNHIPPLGHCPDLPSKPLPNPVRPRGVSEADAATILGLSVSTLRKSRMNGVRERHVPPVPFVRAGRRVIYLLEDLENWIQVHRVSFEVTYGN